MIPTKPETDYDTTQGKLSVGKKYMGNIKMLIIFLHQEYLNYMGKSISNHIIQRIPRLINLILTHYIQYLTKLLMIQKLLI